MLIRLLIVILVISVETDSKNFKSKNFLKQKGYSSNSKHTIGECGNELLTCVPEEDCELECPYGFDRIGGTCYYFSRDEFNPNRTLSEAEDYCDSLNSKLLWIEDSKELIDITDFHENISTPTSAPGMYFIAAEYNPDHGSWVWIDTYDKIEWDILLFGTVNSSTSLSAIANANTNKCLVLNLPQSSSNGSLILESECLDSKKFICKMGEARARCSKTTSTKCCFSSAYDFYVQDRRLGYTTLNLRPGRCQMKINNLLMMCEEVLSSIKLMTDNKTNLYSPARVGSSYYYLVNRTANCTGRDAIIKDEEVHNFFSSLFATRENFFANQSVKVGLTFDLDDQMAYWVDGKPEEYYDTFWFPGEPKRDDSVDGGCAAYSNLHGSSTYLWKLFSKQMCDGFLKACELPLFQSTADRLRTNKNCGRRQERGVLAKSVHSAYSTEEANFGEFPWQAAVMHPEKYGREIKRKFACSGALIHESFVLTSAHCVTSVSVQKDLVVTLGIHDLRDQESILEPLVVDVEEIFIHDDFNIRSSLNDLALLQLKDAVDVDLYPHIGIGCLPDPDEIRSHGGEWECFATGWSNEVIYGSKTKLLKRIEVSFTSESFCRSFSREYYDSLRYENQKRYQGNNKYRYDHEAEVLCTTVEGDCLDDPSPVLVCKKASSYVRRPFFSSGTSSYDQVFKNPAAVTTGTYVPKEAIAHNDKLKNIFKKESINEIVKNKPKRSIYEPYDDDYIVNSYGESRFDSDVWYIIGIGNALSDCRNGHHSLQDYDKERYPNTRYPRHHNGEYHPQRRPNFNSFTSSINRRRKTEVFTSVYEYINFIYYILDLYQ